MIRWIAALTAALTLSGCVTERVVYRDRYVDGPYAGSTYRDGSYTRYDDRYSSSGTYYAPTYAGRGDYYYGYDSYSYDNYPSWYWDYPAYYSVFWPMYRSWYDPYWYPHYYYGVTYYPRNYFSISFGSGWGWPRYGSWSYSPYRYSWVDNYYDWTPWHGHHGYRHNRHQAPRYGSARNEAERLSRHSDWNQRGYGGGYNAERGVRSDGTRDTAFGRYGTTRDGSRDADYVGQPAPRQLPSERGFGVRSGAHDNDVRRNAYGDRNSARQMPGTRGFGVPVDGSDVGSGRGVSSGAQAPRELPSTRGFGVPAQPGRESYAAPAPRGYEGVRPSATREASRYGAAPNRGYDTGVTVPRRSTPSSYEPRRYEAPVAREYSRPATRDHEVSAAARGYRAEPRESYLPRTSSAPARGYDAGASAPRFESRSEPRFESRPEPRFEPRVEARSEPRFESRPEPRYESRSEPRFESRSESSDRGVRRVGSDRDED